MTRTGAILREGASALASFVVAGGAALYLAAHLAPRYDEFHTLAYLQDDGLGSLWRSYRDVGDTLPPSAYVSWWAWSRVAGTSLLAARVPSVLAWAAAAAAVTGLTRRAGAWASFGAGLLASATSLVFLGAFARPYAAALACLAVALWCWQRSATARRPAGWLIGSGAWFAAASALHYATAAVGVVVAVVAFVGIDRARRGWGPVLAPALGGVVPVLLSAALLPQAIDDQGRLGQAAGPVDVLSFWPSALRPSVAVLVPVAVVVGAAWWWPGAGRSVLRSGLLDRDVRRVGGALVVVVPVVTVAAMAVTSGTYVHRYTIGALLGGAVVLAEVVGRSARRWAWVGAVVALAMAAGVGLGVRSITEQMVSSHQVDQLIAEVRGAAGTGDLVVLDEYDFLLLRRSAPPETAARLRLGSEPAVAHSPAPVDLAARLGGADGDPFTLIATQAEVDDLVARSEGWRADVRARVSYPRPGSAKDLVIAIVRPA